MRNKKLRIIIIAVIVLAIVGFFVMKSKKNGSSDEVIAEIRPVIGSINTFISTTGTVLPKNRLEIKPPVNGRIDSIMVKEGDKVTAGQTVAWMSSTERAALLDAAGGQGQDQLKYWQDVYKAIPLSSPIDGEVIVATIQPGQTITTSDAVIVLSDHLIVRAQVDETDIGKIKPDQKANIALDAYPDSKILSVVEHIYYESQTVNNVTIYNVDLLPDQVPPFFRSGMNASVDFIDQAKENVFVIPSAAVEREKDGNYVLVKQNGKEPVKTRVTLGASDDKNIEVVSGVDENSVILSKTKKYNLPSKSTETNPFMPRRR